MKIGKGAAGYGVSAIKALAKGSQQQGGQQRQGQGRSTVDIRVQKMMHDRMMDSFERPKSAVDRLSNGAAKVLQQAKSPAKPKSALGTLFNAFGKLF